MEQKLDMIMLECFELIGLGGMLRKQYYVRFRLILSQIMPFIGLFR